jgi:hypothetical protein
VTGPTPGRVLRLAVLAWGLGDLALGRSVAGVAWLATEVLAAAALVVSMLLFADTSWYLLPFLLGVGFLAAWAMQAVLAYRHAQQRQGAVAPAAARSPALTIAWLALPLLLWGTGFWLLAADAATPDALMDRFLTDWPEAAAAEIASGADPFAALTADPAALRGAASTALDRLQQLCQAGQLPEDCGTTPANLLRDVRVRIVTTGDDGAVAVAELVTYERRPSTLLWFITASELVPVPREEILTVDLQPEPAALGAVRWTIVNAEPG